MAGQPEVPPEHSAECIRLAQRNKSRSSESRPILHFRVAGQVRLNAKMSRAPGAEDAHGLDEFLAGTGKRVGDLRRRRVRNLTTDNAVCFELTELSRQDFFADAREKFAKLGEALGTEAQMPDGRDLPF